MGYTLQQLLSMGATPVPQPGQPSPADAYNAYANNVKTGQTSVQGSSSPNLLSSLLAPITKGVASGIRGIQSIPDTVSAGINLAKGNKTAADSKLTSAQATQDKPLLGQNTYPTQTPLQDVGDAAQVGSLLVGGEGAAAEDSLGQKAITGGIQGAKIGAVGNTGAYLANTDKPTAKGALDAELGGAAGGVAVGAGAPLAEAGIKAGQEMINSFGSEAGSSAVNQSSRMADATPNYNKKMVSDYTKNSEGKTVPRVNEGTGITGKRTVNASKAETEAGGELAKLKNYPDKGTFLQKTQAVHDSISSEAENMRSGLQAEDKATPLDAEAEKAKVASLVKSNLPKDIQEKLGYLSPEQEAKLTPAAKQYREAMIAQQEETLPKTAAGRYYQQTLDALQDYDGTREGKLNLRQTIDNAYKNARGKLAFGTDSQNALDETNSDIRTALNKDLKATTQNTDTQASLDKQSRLYRAHDVLSDKASEEDVSELGRFFDAHPGLSRAKNILRRQGIMVPLRVAEAAGGIYGVEKAAEGLTKKK